MIFIFILNCLKQLYCNPDVSHHSFKLCFCHLQLLFSCDYVL